MCIVAHWRQLYPFYARPYTCLDNVISLFPQMCVSDPKPIETVIIVGAAQETQSVHVSAFTPHSILFAVHLLPYLKWWGMQWVPFSILPELEWQIILHSYPYFEWKERWTDCCVECRIQTLLAHGLRVLYPHGHRIMWYPPWCQFRQTSLEKFIVQAAQKAEAHGLHPLKSMR